MTEQVTNEKEADGMMNNGGQGSEAAGKSGQQIEINEEEMAQFISSINTFMQEKEELEQRLVRLQADFDNFRKRTRQEKEEMVKAANQRIVGSLLPVVDNFERALSSKHNKTQAPMMEGIEMIYRQLLAVLAEAGLEAQEVIGKDFDPNYHEAVIRENVGEDEKGKILMEIQKGYLFHGKLLRPAMVKVGI